MLLPLPSYQHRNSVVLSCVCVRVHACVLIYWLTVLSQPFLQSEALHLHTVLSPHSHGQLHAGPETGMQQ